MVLPLEHLYSVSFKIITSKLFIFTLIFIVSSTSGSSGLGLLIFFAILLHKTPASIGFGTFLHHEGLRGWALSKHLLVSLLPPYQSINTNLLYK